MLRAKQEQQQQQHQERQQQIQQAIKCIKAKSIWQMQNAMHIYGMPADPVTSFIKLLRTVKCS